MATKKKTSKRPKKAKKTAGKKATPKKLGKRQKAVKRPKKVAKKKSAPKKAVKRKASPKKRTRKKNANLDPVTFSPLGAGSRSGEQSGDLQGLSSRESADSESVDELAEEGNAFEAEVVAGVERAGDEDEKEVRTREVPEDDVPVEYLDED
jgi:hypothetical protein